MDNGFLVEVIHGGHDAVLEFLFGCDADMSQHRAGELGEEALDEIEPGAVFGCEGEFEAAGPPTALRGVLKRVPKSTLP